MPHNENPYRSDEPLYSAFENGSSELQAALLADYKKTYSDGRIYDDLKSHVTELHDATVSALSADPYAPVTWGQPSERDFTCPSGQVCRVRRVDVMDLLSGGLLNNVDFLTAVVRDQHIPNAQSPTGNKPEDTVEALKKMSAKGADMAGFRDTIQSVVLRVVAKPILRPVPPDGEGRRDDWVYIDSVPMTDQTSIFNWAITGQDEESLKQFRQQTGEPVGNVEHGEVVQHATVHLPGDKPSG
jgi:hypothetical protein